jgi:thymidylate kinase
MTGTAGPAPGPRGAGSASALETGPGDDGRRSNSRCVPRGLFVAIEGIDGAGKTTAARVAAEALRSRGRPAVAVARGDAAGCSAYAATHMAALLDLIWGEPPDAPYLDLGDDHWGYLQAAWYSAFAHCVVLPAIAEGSIVLADTWGYKFLAKLAMRPAERVSFDAARAVFEAIPQPDVVIHLHADPAVAAARKPAFSGSETGNREGVPELSAGAFAAYQRDLAEVLESFAGKGGWVCVDTSSLSPVEAGSAVADIAELHVRPAGAVTRRVCGDGSR